MSSHKQNPIIARTFRNYSLLYFFSQLIAYMGAIADSLIISRMLDTRCLGVVGIVTPLLLVYTTVANLFCVGGSARSLFHIGHEDFQTASKIYTDTLIGTILAAIPLSLAGLLLPEHIAALLGAKDELLQPARDYIFGISLGAVPIMLSLELLVYAQCDNGERISIVAMVVQVVANLVLDVVAAKLGWNMLGMGLATSVSYYLTLFILCLHPFSGKGNLHWLPGRVSWRELSNIVMTSLPDLINDASFAVCCVVYNGILSVSSIIVFAVVGKVLLLYDAILVGVGQAIIVLTELFMGERDRSAIVHSFRAFCMTVPLAGVPIALVTWIFAPQICWCFNVVDPETQKAGVFAVRCVAFGFNFALAVELLYFYWIGCGYSIIASSVAILRNFVFPLAIVALLYRSRGDYAVWIALFAADLLAVALVPIFVSCKRKRIVTAFDDIMVLPDDFGVGPELVCTLNAGMDDVMAMTARVREFCLDHGVDSRRANLTALCLEEMAGNVVRFGYATPGKHTIDIRVIVEPRQKDVCFRMRDNARPFNPFRSLSEDDDTMKNHLGIRLVHGVAKHVDYRYTTGLNNIVVVL